MVRYRIQIFLEQVYTDAADGKVKTKLARDPKQAFMYHEEFEDAKETYEMIHQYLVHIQHLIDRYKKA